MADIKEAIRNIKAKAETKGLAVSATIGGISNGAMLPLETWYTTAAHELSKAEPNLTNVGAVALSAGLNIWSIRKEAQALKQEGYAASPGGTVLNAVLEKPHVSATLDHVANFGLLTVLNPINAAAIANNDPDLLRNSMYATLFTIATWNIPFNQAIIDGKADAIVERIKSFTQPPAIEPVTNFDYHRFQRNMRNR